MGVSGVSDITVDGAVNWSVTLLKTVSCLPSAWVHGAVAAFCGNARVRRHLESKGSRRLAGIAGASSILVVADVNLGDSINTQAVVRVLRRYFPQSRLDYVHSAVAAPLIRHNPHLSHSVPLFKGGFFPSAEQVRALADRVRRNAYDVVLSFCPFLDETKIGADGATVLSPLALTCRIIHRACNGGDLTAHLLSNMAAYVEGVVCNGRASPGVGDRMHGVTIYLPASAAERRDRWLAGHGIPADSRPIFLNPDASNVYTFVDEDLQAALLRGLLARPECEHLLLGSGFTFKGVERRLLERLSPPLRRKVTVVPDSLPIDVYAALIDACAVFITADTGPMHVAAARKECPDREGIFVNRTALAGLFGPTLPRVYGYDSATAGYLPANQDAPSRVFQGACPRKSLLCSVERIAGRCGGGDCFRGLNVDRAARFALECAAAQKDR